METCTIGQTSAVDRRRVVCEQKLARRKMLERVWIVLGLAWAVGRVLIAKATVEKYGVNIAVFAFLELALAWPHSVGAARVVTKLIDRDPTGALPWGLLLAVTHVAPELYIAVAGSNMSTGIYLSLIVIVLGLGALAGVGMAQKVRAGRAERATSIAVIQSIELTEHRSSEVDAALAALVERTDDEVFEKTFRETALAPTSRQ